MDILSFPDSVGAWRLRGLLAVSALVAACAGSEGTGPEAPPIVSRVEVTPAEDAVVIGGAVRFSARALTADGDVVPGVPVTWSTDDPQVASVDPSGFVTALNLGTVTVTATVHGVTGGAVLSVQRPTEPPFQGTAFLHPGLILPSDPSSFRSLTSMGRGLRTMFDRRVDDWVTMEAHLFEAAFEAGRTVEVQVNPELGSQAAAAVEAERYAEIIGRLPATLRRDVETVWIHRGEEPFGGGNRNLLIHLEQGERYAADGFLEEILVHEAVHTSLDADHAASPGWLAARAADGVSISRYAEDFPDREDLAESFVPWMAVRRLSDRIPESTRNLIQATIPNRIAYLDALAMDWHPLR